MNKDFRVLITGGQGFIGSHLVRRLLSDGFEDILVSDISDDRLEVDNLPVDPRITRMPTVGSIKYDEMLNFLSGVKYVFHLASMNMADSQRKPSLCVKVNVLATLKLIEAASEVGAHRLVYSSASSVYGNSNKLMEESDPPNPNTIYGASKVMTEFLLSSMYHKLGLPYIALRYMNVYGPGQRVGLIPTVVRNIRDGRKPTILGDGSQAFDFVYIDDVVDANLLAMDCECQNEAFNVGSGTESTVKEIILKLLEYSKSGLTPLYKRDVTPSSLRRVGSIKKAGSMLGYKPKVSLTEGLMSVATEAFNVNSNN